MPLVTSIVASTGAAVAALMMAAPPPPPGMPPPPDGMPPGMPPMPPDMPPMPPGMDSMPPMPPDMPPMPPGMDSMPPPPLDMAAPPDMPPMPPGMDSMPPPPLDMAVPPDMPPMPPGMDSMPPMPPEMPPMPPGMDSIPPPPGEMPMQTDLAPPMPEIPAPPSDLPPSLDEAPMSLDIAPPAPEIPAPPEDLPPSLDESPMPTEITPPIPGIPAPPGDMLALDDLPAPAEMPPMPPDMAPPPPEGMPPPPPEMMAPLPDFPPPSEDASAPLDLAPLIPEVPAPPEGMLSPPGIAPPPLGDIPELSPVNDADILGMDSVDFDIPEIPGIPESSQLMDSEEQGDEGSEDEHEPIYDDGMNLDLDLPEIDSLDLDHSTDTEIVTEQVSGDESFERVIAGASLRTLEDIDAIEGDKFMGDLIEEHTLIIDEDGVVAYSGLDGILRMTNPSTTDLIWDVDANLINAGRTSLQQFTEGEHVAYMRTMEPGDVHDVSYEADLSKVLDINERLVVGTDAPPESMSIPVSVGDVPFSVHISVTNVSEHTIKNVVLERPIPDGMDITSSEGCDIENGVLSWATEELFEPGESHNIDFEGTVRLDEAESIPQGNLIARWASDAAVSGARFDVLDAQCRIRSSVDVDEGLRPNVWECSVAFDNRSSFVVDVVRVHVTVESEDEPMFDIEDLDKDILPGETWSTEIVTIESEGQPMTDYEVTYTALPRASYVSEGKVNLHRPVLTAIEGRVLKSYSNDILRTFQPQDIIETITVENNGTATIDHLVIEDTIPGVFDLPEITLWSYTMDGEPCAPSATILSRPAPTEGPWVGKGDTEGPGNIVTLDLGSDIPLGLRPGSSLGIEVTLHAPDPDRANNVIEAPATASLRAVKGGPVAERYLDKDTTIRCMHKRRRLRSTKEVMPVMDDHHFEVEINITNRSDCPLEDLQIHDTLPEGVVVTTPDVKSSSEVGSEPETALDGEGVQHLVWNVPRIEMEETVIVTFVIDVPDDVEFKISDARKMSAVTGGIEVLDGDEEVVEQSSEEIVIDTGDPEMDEALEVVRDQVQNKEWGEESMDDGDLPDFTTLTQDAVASVMDGQMIEFKISEEDTEEEEPEEEESVEEESEEEESEEEEPEEEIEKEERPIPRHSRHVLNEVAEEHGLDPDVLLIHAIDFDFDNNGYLNRKELKAAGEDLAAEKPEEEYRACPICDAHNDVGANECSDCGHFFTD